MNNKSYVKNNIVYPYTEVTQNIRVSVNTNYLYS